MLAATFALADRVYEARDARMFDRNITAIKNRINRKGLRDLSIDHHDDFRANSRPLDLQKI
jgi:hypothetical protein